MVNEAARCMEEKVVDSPEDADYGMILGNRFRAIPRRAIAIRGTFWNKETVEGIGTAWRELKRNLLHAKY